MAELNVGSDPINPAYYAGTACAEIIEHMPTNVGFAAKYAWRLGEKDSEAQEAAKAIWYLKREISRQHPQINVPWGYESRAYALAREANIQGKLDIVRAEIVCVCIAYTMDESHRHLHRAIELFQTYL